MMSFFKNIKVRTKLILLFLIVIAVMSIADFTGVLIYRIIALLLSLAISLFVANDIHAELLKMVHIAENMSNFDFSDTYQVNRKDEFGKAGEALVKASGEYQRTYKVNNE
jgi:methyl-accepting chemotaxis protein